MTSIETGAAASTPNGAAEAASEASTLAVAGLPVDTLREAIPYLRRPFTPEAIRFKIQTVFKDAKGCLVVGYIDARLVTERLNLVVPDMWRAEYQPVEGKPNLMWCHLTVKQDGRGWLASALGEPTTGGVLPPASVTRSDVGEGQGMNDGQKYKAAVSDALKRAAVHFGIGVSVYALPQITLWANGPHVEKKGTSLSITEGGHVKLREGYAKWLEEHGERLFGPALDHGDVQGATFEEDDEPGEFTPEAPTPLADERAAKLHGEIHAVYDGIRGIDSTRVPPGTFNGWLTGAAHSHEELERLRDHLQGVLDGMQGDAA